MLILNAEMSGKIMDVELAGGRIGDLREAGQRDARTEEEVVDAKGGALLPGLHDHHIHLLALSAALTSIDCGPPSVNDRTALQDALASARPRAGWIRGTGYFESVAGDLDRDTIDALRADVPVRIQHRSGAMWFLNSRALEVLGAASLDATSPLELDASGRPTGRLFRGDEWIRDRIPQSGSPDLRDVGRLLASFGVTSFTDCTPSNDTNIRALIQGAQSAGALPQRVQLMGSLELRDHDATEGTPLLIDAHKIMLDEPALPDLESLTQRIGDAHDEGRCVAIHTVTRAELQFALIALEEAGPRRGDRLEHASIAPPESVETIQRLGIAVVTQPNFVAERGDAYRRNVEPLDQPYLYRLQSWLDAQVTLGAGTDAPFGNPDPWKAIRAATDRRTRTGAVLGDAERISPETALALFHPRILTRGALREPGLAVGDRADLCLLSVPWNVAREKLASDLVIATWCAGKQVYGH